MITAAANFNQRSWIRRYYTAMAPPGVQHDAPPFLAYPGAPLGQPLRQPPSKPPDASNNAGGLFGGRGLW